MANKSGIRIKPENRGKLRAKLGAKPGKKLSAKSLSTAKKSTTDSATKKQIVFAQNARGWNKKKKGR